MMNALSTSDDPSELKSVKRIFIISGVYNLVDVRRTSVNINNLLSLTDENVSLLSPVHFDYSGWSKDIQINILAAENESPTFIQQSIDLHSTLKDKLNCNYKLIGECDHFDIVEKMLELSFEITQMIVTSTKKNV